MKLGKFALFLILSVSACKPSVETKQEVDEGEIDKRTYTSNEVGWTIKIPLGWKISSLDSAKAEVETGLKAIENVYGGEIEATELRHLVGFEKDLFNSFSSTSEPFKLEYEGEYEENNQRLYELVYDALDAQGVKIDTSSGSELVGGKKYDVLYSRVYDVSGNYVMDQILYSRLINGLDFSVNINYNNEDDKKILVDAFKNSTFTK